MDRDVLARLVGMTRAPQAITAEAAHDLRDRWSVIASNAALVAEIASGKWRADQNEAGGAELPRLTIDGDIGVIGVSGPLFKTSGGVDDMFRLFLGCTPYDDLWSALEHCQERGLKGAIMRVNSPGGDVGGCGEFADYVYSLKGKFKVWTYAETQCASAAQWIAAQTERTVAHETALLGWIGVIRGPILDDSKFLEEHGFSMKEVVSKHAKAKRTVPLDDEVLARFQVMCDDLGDCFEKDVARGRGVSPEKVAADFGAGDGLIARKALGAELIDDIGSFNSTLKALREETSKASVVVAVPTPAAQPAARAEAPVTAHRKKETTMAKPIAGIRAEEGEPKETKKGDAKRAEAEGKRAKADAKRADAKKCEAEADEMEKEDKKEDAAAKRAEAKRCEAEADEMESKADKLESEADEMDAEESDGDEGKKALAALSGLRVSASISAHTAAIDAKMVPRAKVTALETRVANVEADRAAEKKAAEDAKLNALADHAGTLGYFAGLTAEQTKAKRERFIKIARNEPDAAEEIISALPGARIQGRTTQHGNPTGGRHSSTTRIDAFDGKDGIRRVSHGDVDTLEKGSTDLMAKAREHAAQNKCSVEEAMVAVTKADPSLMA